MAGLESMVVEEVKPAEKPVDREKVRYHLLDIPFIDKTFSFRVFLVSELR